MDVKVKLLSIVLVFCVLVPVVDCRTCKKKSSCSCESDEGVVNLKPLNKGTRFLDYPGLDGWLYSYNPCKDFSESDDQATVAQCSGVAICQNSKDKHEYYNLGSQSSAAFQFMDGQNVAVPDSSEVLTVTYSSSVDVVRTAVIALICDENEEGKFEPIGEIAGSNPPQYILKLTSKYACFKPLGISAGSVLLIIFFILLFIYLVGGIMFNLFYRHNSGKDVIPHRVFWSSTFPGLVKDGALFLVKRGQYHPIGGKG